MLGDLDYYYNFYYSASQILPDNYCYKYEYLWWHTNRMEAMFDDRNMFGVIKKGTPVRSLWTDASFKFYCVICSGLWALEAVQRSVMNKVSSKNWIMFGNQVVFEFNTQMHPYLWIIFIKSFICCNHNDKASCLLAKQKRWFSKCSPGERKLLPMRKTELQSFSVLHFSHFQQIVVYQICEKLYWVSFLIIFKYCSEIFLLITDYIIILYGISCFPNLSIRFLVEF